MDGRERLNSTNHEQWPSTLYYKMQPGKSNSSLQTETLIRGPISSKGTQPFSKINSNACSASLLKIAPFIVNPSLVDAFIIVSIFKTPSNPIVTPLGALQLPLCLIPWKESKKKFFYGQQITKLRLDEHNIQQHGRPSYLSQAPFRASSSTYWYRAPLIS